MTNNDYSTYSEDALKEELERVLIWLGLIRWPQNSLAETMDFVENHHPWYAAEAILDDQPQPVHNSDE